MTDKEKKVREVFNHFMEAVRLPVHTVYDLNMMQNQLINKLDKLYEAGYTEGELSKIKEQ